MSTGALTGIRVLDLGRLLAAPAAAQVLGDLGADVIKVERPGSGDMARFAGPSFLTDEEGQVGQSSLFISANRAAYGAELIAVLQQLFLKHSKQDLVAALQRAEVAGAPVQDYDEVFADPQVLELGMRAEVPHPHDSAATVPGVGSPFRLSATPPSYQRHPPALGEHTDEILRELLDCDDATISRLRGQGAI